MSANFCRVCSSANPEAICKNCGCDPLNGNEYCNNCGGETKPQAVMCPNCQTYFLKSGETRYVDNYEDLGVNRESKDRYRPLLIIFVLLCLSVAAYKYFSGRKTEEPKPKTEAEKRYEDMQNYLNASSPDTSFTPYKAISRGNEEDLKSLIEQTETEMTDARNLTASHNGEMNEAELTELKQQLVKLKKIKQSLQTIDTWSKDLDYDVDNTVSNINKVNLQIDGLQMKVNGLEEILTNQQKYRYTPPVVKKE